MKVKNVAVFETNEEFLNDIKACISGQDGYNLCAVSSDGLAALDLLKNTSPDVAVVDLVLGGLDGFGVLDYIKRNNPDCMSLAVSSYVNDRTVNRAIDLGATYYLVKPVKPETLLARIKELTEETSRSAESVNREMKKENSLDEKISNIFITLGIPPHIMGYAYAREGVKLVYADPSIINRVTKDLYPRIAEKFHTSSSKVERAIRHAIDVAWNRGRVDAIWSVFGVKVYIGSQRPTNSEFIALVADKLKFELWE